MCWRACACPAFGVQGVWRCMTKSSYSFFLRCSVVVCDHRACLAEMHRYGHLVCAGCRSVEITGCCEEYTHTYAKGVRFIFSHFSGYSYRHVSFSFPAVFRLVLPVFSLFSLLMSVSCPRFAVVSGQPVFGVQGSCDGVRDCLPTGE